MRAYEFITEAKSVKQRLDPRCWKGKHKEGTKIKGGVRVNNCVPNKNVAEARVEINQDAPDNLYDIQDKLEMSRWKSSVKNVITSLFAKRYPDVQLFFKNTQAGNLFVTTDKTALASEDIDLYSDTNEFGASIIGPTAEYGVDDILYVGIGFDSIKSGKYKGIVGEMLNTIVPPLAAKFKAKPAIIIVVEDQSAGAWEAMANKLGWAFISGEDEQDVAEALTPYQMFDIIEEMVERAAAEHGVDPELIWEDFDSVDDDELYESAAWHRKAGKSKTGGLNKKGVASYRREHPGSKLQMAVTIKPSKLKKGSKAAKRRKSFCARMSGVKGPMKKPNGKPTRKALALRKWNC